MLHMEQDQETRKYEHAGKNFYRKLKYYDSSNNNNRSNEWLENKVKEISPKAE